MKGRVCAIVDTPYQLLNCLNIIYNSYKQESLSIDLYVMNCEYFSDQMIQRIKKTQLFESIVRFNEVNDSETKRNTFTYNKERITRAFFPKSYITSICDDKNCLKQKKYDCLICAFDTPIALAFSMAFPDIRIVLFDEGTASYTNGIAPITRNRDILFSIKRKKNPWRNIDIIFVNNKEYYRDGLAKKAIQLPSLNECEPDFMATLFSVFDYKGSKIYDNEYFVYLIQPISEGKDEYNNIQKNIIGIIEDNRPTCIARKHPKQRNVLESTLPYDNDNDLWELVCSQRITDNHVLIGAFSTAQLIPKLIFDIEPWIVFTHRLYDGWIAEDRMRIINQLIDSLRDEYQNEGKIVVVNTVEELEAFFITMMEKES